MPITPQILNLSNLFRQRLLARERRAATTLVYHYGNVWRQLQGDIAALSSEVRQLQEAGEEFSQDKIYRLDRYRALQQTAEEQMARFPEYANDIISGGQRESIYAGESDAYNLLLAGFPRDDDIVAELARARLPTEAVEQLVGFLQDGSPLKEVIQKYVGEAVNRFGEQMVVGLAAGWNPRKLARALRSEFGMGLSNALRIARTEQLRAYRAATLNTYQENSFVFKSGCSSVKYSISTVGPLSRSQNRIFFISIE